ncbi:hypothetical protein [Neobacillus ginsengisoli]|uniref:Uncharacterized protein n=1 Tax=Neobacillus ginsengisoli TaxID=904295 RepID=A0ABT9Y0P3_9BACI|nr:hypothetical protein [Neobacillus ginsengisoli]MDQ0201383.1 hypothetical protein [Neobacillus ginsengisoli]
MSKLEFLEINRNFKSYYRTLRDVNYYLINDTELDKEQIQATTQVLTKLIYGFIRTNGTLFRDMTSEQYNKEYHMFYDDFFSIIENSGVNNVDFDNFTTLLDEIIGVANSRTDTLRRIKKSMQEDEADDEEDEGLEIKISSEKEDDDEEKDAADEVSVVTGGANVVHDPKDVGVTAERAVNDKIKVGSNKSANVIEKVGIVSNEVKTFDVEELDEEINTFESEDVFHYRPKRKRYR